MKVIIAGSRSINDYTLVEKAVEQSGFPITEVVSGCAKGVDTLAIRFAEFNELPVKRFHADWDKYKKAAGYRRNGEMATYADALIAIWDGHSPGTVHMINIAKERGLKVFTHFLGD